MNKRVISVLIAVVLLLSSFIVLPPTYAGSSENRIKVDLNKLAPDLKTKIESMPDDEEIRVVVLLEDGVSKAEAKNLIISLGGKINAEHNIINAISASVPAEKVKFLTAIGNVKKVLMDHKKFLIPIPKSDDSGAAIENLLETYQYWYSQFPFWIGADKAWEMGINGSGVVVAILDTGIFYEHPDLCGVVIDYRVFTSEEDVFPHDGYGHGTACAGCLAAQGIVDWDLGVPGIYFKVKGVAPGAKIIGGKVLTDAGWGWDSWIIQGIEWAVESGADIISMSLGGLEIPNDGNDPTALACDAATKMGVTVFVAAGNSQGHSTVSSAGCAKDVITVGASTENSFVYWWLGYWPFAYADGYENDQLIFWSSGGPTGDGRVDPDVCAIGAWGFTLDTYPYYLWLQFGGTSMATPIAAGVGALVIQAYRHAHGISPTPKEVKSILMNTAKDLGYDANRQGAGRVDAYEAVLAAMSERPYSDTGAINTGIVKRGRSYTTEITFTGNVEDVQAVRLEMVDSITFEGLTVEYPGTFLEFEIPEGVEFADIKLKFPPEYAFGVPIREYNGSQWTDIHLNTVLYRVEEDGRWIMINYAYAHTNIQWFNARVTPGDYVLWIWNMYEGLTVEPVDVKITFYKFSTWNWITTCPCGNNLIVNIRVPWNADPGDYSGFLKVTCDGKPINIPVVVTVPALLGEKFTVEAQIPNEPRDYISGDWFYIPVYAPAVGYMTLTVSWTQPDADFDVYLIAPNGQVEALSWAPEVPITLPGGGGRYWYTITGTTMEVLSTFNLYPGYWLIGIQTINLGNIFSETLTIKLECGNPISAPGFIYMKAGEARTFEVRNKIAGTIPVEVMALTFKTETFVEEVYGTVYSFNDTYLGYDAWLIPVTPDIITLTISLDWEGAIPLRLAIYDPAGACFGIISEKGGEIKIFDPAIGYWFAVITIHEVGSADYTLKLSGTRFKPFEGVTLTPESFVLDPYGTQTLTIITDPSTKGYGFIVYYSMETGSIYSYTLLIIGKLYRCYGKLHIR